MADENMDLPLTAAEEEALKEIFGKGDYPKEDEKHNLFTFFNKILVSKDTTRTANLNEEELGLAILPIRTDLELSLFCNKMGMEGFSHYFKEEGMITTDSSLSREGFLINKAVTQKREFERKQRRMTVNKGWFRRKKEPEEQF